MSTLNVFGEMISGVEVEEGFVSSLKMWLPTYLREQERQSGRVVGSLPVPRSWQVMTALEHWPEDQIPAVIVISPGLFDPPVRRGDGLYEGWWAVAAGAIVSANTQHNTNRLARDYAAAIRAVMLQKRADDPISSVEWVDESYDELPPEDSRTLSVAMLAFRVHVAGIVRTYGGPAVPDENPADWPVIDETSVTIQEKIT